MPHPVSFAVVGLDHWYSALPLAAGLAQHPDTELVAVADPDIRRRAAAIDADLTDTLLTEDWKSVIARPDVDVIASFVPVALNPEVCIAAARAGKHIVSIKPFARTLEEGRAILDAVRAAGVELIPAESRSRETEQNQWLKSVFDSGELGAFVSADLRLSGVLPQAWPDAPAGDTGWWGDPDLAPGGGWIDHAIYQIDRLRWLTGTEPVAVQGDVANLVHTSLPVEDYGHALFEFEGGQRAAIEDTWSGAPGAWRISSTYSFENGAIDIDTTSAAIKVFRSDGTGGAWEEKGLLVDDSELIEPLVERVRNPRSTDLGTVEDAMRNLAACLAFYEAANDGRRHSIDDH